MKYYCNPLNLNYRFQIKSCPGESHREAADPSMVRFQDRFWLFPSKSGGYWHSDDLADWHFVATDMLPTEDYAPDVRVMGDYIYFTASRNQEPCSIYRSKHPEKDEWEEVVSLFPYWDPNMYQDDDGRVYLYWGCSDKFPIYGIELDPQKMTTIGEKKELIHSNTEDYGWERYWDYQNKPTSPYVEGPWLNKWRGKYYLQYAVPGTQEPYYADGVYVGDGPLGPFTCQDHNPYSLKPGGFINGAGHGSTFEDSYGNIWHTSTMKISVKHDFERRLGLWPAGLDEDGILFCNTRFGDYPQKLPEGKWNPGQDSFTGWMLLSYNKKITASDCRKGHTPELANDEQIETWWCASERKTHWLSIDLGEEYDVSCIQVNFYEDGCDQYGREGAPLYHQYILEGSADGDSWFIISDKSKNNQDVPHDLVALDKAVKTRHVRLTINHMAGNGSCAVSGFRVFGLGTGSVPAAVTKFNHQYREADLEIDLDWEKKPGATGYNVLWGIAEDKLYNSWLVYGQDSLTLTALKRGMPCYVRIDAFNENGISEGKVLKVC